MSNDPGEPVIQLQQQLATVTSEAANEFQTNSSENKVPKHLVDNNNNNSNIVPLARNLSIPANFKLKKQNLTLVGCSRDANQMSVQKTYQDDKNMTKTKITRSLHDEPLVQSYSVKTNGAEMERRHSERQLSNNLQLHNQQNNRFCHIQQQHQQKHKMESADDDDDRIQANQLARHVADEEDQDNKQVSVPSSLRASDSAFSQSQSTLEEESDFGSGDRSSSSFSRSINELSKSTRRNLILMMSEQHEQDCNKTSARSKWSNQLVMTSDSKKTESGHVEDLYDLPPGGQDKSPDGFRVIWRDLSFRVPEKRFAQLNTYWKRYKESIWSSGDNQKQPAPAKQAMPPSPSTSSVSTHLTNATEMNQQQQQVVVQSADAFELDEPPDLVYEKSSTSSSNLALAHNAPRKIIFDNLNGCAESGKLTAILGPSGAGKTTLLNCLTGTGSLKDVSGSILINNYGPGQANRKHLKLCIIPQKDYLFDKLTVTENLLFASRLKNTQKNFDHLTNIQRVTDLLGLQACLALKTEKLSGGQYKRVSIAQELLSKPDILILDEPTSGLDSRTCYKTVSVLCDLVNLSRQGFIKPLAIIMTIHQPPKKVFELCHHVYIMSSLGNCIYEGRPEDLIDTVADCCKLLPPPDDLNPASFIIDVASQVYGSEPTNKLIALQRENFLAQHGHNDDDDMTISGDISDSANCKQADLNGQLAIFMPTDNSSKHNNNKCDTIKERTSSNNNNGADEPRRLIISDCLRKCNTQDRCFWLHTWLLMKRLWVAMWRDPLLATTRIAFHVIVPFIFYFIYSRRAGDANACPIAEREIDIQALTSEENLALLHEQHQELIYTFENVSLFFLLLYSFSMCVLAITALSFPLNMQILLKETSNGWYSMSRFVMAKSLADLPMEIMMPVISVSIAYYLTGQPGSYMSWRMLTITFVMTLCSLISQTQGLLFGAYFMNNVQAAVFISQASSLPWILLSGFTSRVIELPTVLRWVSFASIYRLGIEAIVAARYGFGMCACDRDQVDGKPSKLIGISDQLRSIMRYYFEMYAEQNNGSSTTDTNNNANASNTNHQLELHETAVSRHNKTSSDDIFERLASTMSRVNTYGVEIVTCDDVRPLVMSARGVTEATLPNFVLLLTLIFVLLKVLLFFVVRLRTNSS